MANEKELTELYSGPGAESFRVFEDENGRVELEPCVPASMLALRLSARNP